MTTVDPGIHLTRVYNASPEIVFKAWTDPELLKQWWAPKGCTTPFCTVDLRVGGKFLFCMRLPDGKDVWALGVYREIVVPERIVYSDTFSDAEGNVVPPSHYGLSDSHATESIVTVTFTNQAEKTLLTLHHTIPSSWKEFADTQKGWSEMLDQLTVILSNV